MSAEGLEPQAFGLRTPSTSFHVRTPGGSRANQRISDESSYRSAASSSTGTRPPSPRTADADPRGNKPTRFSLDPFSQDSSLNNTLRSEITSVSSVGQPSQGTTDTLVAESRTDASTAGDRVSSMTHMTGHMDTRQDTWPPAAGQPPPGPSQPPSPHHDVLQFWASAQLLPQPPPPSAVMSETLRNETLLPRVGLTVILPEYLRHHTVAPLQPAPLLPPRRSMYDLSDDPVDQLLGHYALSKSTSPPPAFRSSRVSAGPRTDPGLQKVGQRSPRPSVDAMGFRQSRRSFLDGAGKEVDVSASDTHLPALPSAASSSLPAQRSRSPVTVTGVGDVLVSRDASYAGGPPSRNPSTTGAPALPEEPSASSVSATYTRKQRLTHEPVPMPSTSPERSPSKALPNGTPLSRLGAAAPHGRPRRGRHQLRGPSEEDILQQRQRISSPKSRHTPVPADSSGDDMPPLLTSSLGGHTMPMTLSRVNGEPMLDDGFYTMVQSHFVTLADSHQQRLQVKLNASLPVILQSFGCTGSAFDRVKKGDSLQQ